jgi:hypothetical protein
MWSEWAQKCWVVLRETPTVVFHVSNVKKPHFGETNYGNGTKNGKRLGTETITGTGTGTEAGKLLTAGCLGNLRGEKIMLMP